MARAVRNEASTWLHGDTATTERIARSQAEWAAELSDAGLEYHIAGTWHANQLLQLTVLHAERDRRAARF